MPGKKARRSRRLARLEQEAEQREASTVSHASSLETQEEPATAQVLEEIRTRLSRASQELRLPLGATRTSYTEDLPPANPPMERTGSSWTTPREQFKPPTFDGTGDVDLFLDHFQDVAEANMWNDRACTLHLRSSLSGVAALCGAAKSRIEIIRALKARFGLSSRQARDRLLTLRREPRQTLHEQALQILRYVEVAYPNLSVLDQEEMAMDHLTRIQERGVQRHLLTVQPTNLNQTVQYIEDYSSIQGPDRTVHMAARAIHQADDDEEEEDTLMENDQRIQAKGVDLNSLFRIVEQQGKLLAQLTQKVEALLQQNRNLPRTEPRRPRQNTPRMSYQTQPRTTYPTQGCFQCGGPHFRRNCPNLGGGRQATLHAPQGNGRGPVQH